MTTLGVSSPNHMLPNSKLFCCNKPTTSTLHIGNKKPTSEEIRPQACKEILPPLITAIVGSDYLRYRRKRLFLIYKNIVASVRSISRANENSISYSIYISKIFTSSIEIRYKAIVSSQLNYPTNNFICASYSYIHVCATDIILQVF